MMDGMASLLFLIIDVIGQGGKVLFLQYRLQSGGRIEEFDFFLTETVTLFPADISGVLTVRTGIMHFHIINGIAGIFQMQFRF